MRQHLTVMMGFLALAAAPLAGGCNTPDVRKSGNAEREATAQSALGLDSPIVDPAIEWPAAASVDARAREALPAEARLLVPRATVPLLIPPAGPAAPLRDVVLIVEAQFYALSARTPEGATLHVQGTRGQHRYEDIAPVPGRTSLHGGALGHVTENEGIRVASWMEHGAAYSVDLECRSPSDAACTSDDAVIAIARSLAYVGGRGAR